MLSRHMIQCQLNRIGQRLLSKQAMMGERTRESRAISEKLSKIAPWLSESNAKNLDHRQNYKGNHGRIGIVGGARDYSGAPYFASMSAMRLGADLAYVICSRDAAQVIKGYSPDLIVVPLLDTSDEHEFEDEMDCLLTRLHSLVIGPGLGREHHVQKRARRLIEKAKSRCMPVILDADSLLMVNQDTSLVQSNPLAMLTPNRIELQRLSEVLFAPEKFDLRGMDITSIQALVRRCSARLNVTILAKGLVDIVCDENQNSLLQTEKLSGTSRRCGGQGDIMSGLASVYVHWIHQYNKGATIPDKIPNAMSWAGYLAAVTTRRCNELSRKEFGHGFLASDMIPKINAAVLSYLELDPVRKQKAKAEYDGSLTQDEIDRYRRQMIMEEFGPNSQTNLKKASALIIGAGGLGCPAAVYLGAAGIGGLGIVDDDKVEASNLHRQILHNMDKVGMLKTESIRVAVSAINPNVTIRTHSVKMNRFNAVELVEQYDIIIDCTDNLLTRYMINDACVVAKKPLVSGAALKMDGQLTVYNYDEATPCFRCLFPQPPPPNAVGSCSDNGVMGVLPGIIGVQQAFEAIKIGAGIRPSYAGKMLLFDGQLGLFRHVNLSKRRPDCGSCGPRSQLGKELIDYHEFCGDKLCKSDTQTNNLPDLNERISVEDYEEIVKSGRPHVLVDVRPKSQSDLSRFKTALQLPLASFVENQQACKEQIENAMKVTNSNEVYVVCRRGIASVKGAKVIMSLFEGKDIVVKDIIGGMTAWSKKIDPQHYACL